MSSLASNKYSTTVSRIDTLRKTATDIRLRPMKQEEVQVYYHAALTAYVAAWNGYISNLVREFYNLISNPSNQVFDAMYKIAQQSAENALGRYNTPNWDNTRNILFQYTGYDPIGDWAGSQSNMNLEQVKQRLSEILNVRHSFAHGYNVRAYVWTQSPSGRIRLTSQAIQETEMFFKNLVKVTDRGMKEHIELTYGLTGIWQ